MARMENGHGANDQVQSHDRRGDTHDEDATSETGVGRLSTEGMIDLDEVAREEMGVWAEERD